MLSEHKGVAYTRKSVCDQQKCKLLVYSGIHFLQGSSEHSEYKALKHSSRSQDICILQKSHILPLESTTHFDLLGDLIPAITQLQLLINILNKTQLKGVIA